MLEIIRETIKKYNMLPDGGRVLVGLSGGADSVALLMCLKELGCEVSACHINHGLRGDESDRDEDFCRRLCDAFNIELFSENIDVKKFCKENKLGIEEGARILRYKTFEKYGFERIATAHTASDSAETVILNLARGTALKGLCGIPPVRGNVIRPLIDVTRKDVEMYLESRGQEYVTDSTNLSDDYSRNKIRHTVIPLLEEINPAAVRNIKKASGVFTADEEFLDRYAQRSFEELSSGEQCYDVLKISKLEKAIKNRVFAKILKAAGVEVSYDKISELEKVCETGRKTNLKKNVYAEVKKGKLVFSHDIVKKERTETVLIPGESLLILEKKVSSSVEPFDGKSADLSNVHRSFTNLMIDYDKIKGEIFAGSRRGGDKIRFIGRGFTTSVKKLFNVNIPLEKRDEVLILRDSEGPFFIDGFGIADRVKIDKTTDKVLVIKLS